MAQSAAPAYRYNYPERAPQRSPRVRVVPGRGTPTVTQSLPSSVVFLAKLFAVVLVVFALLGFVRIGLASATVTTALSTEEVSTKIESARSAGNELEVRESYLSNPTYLKTEATKLNMTAPSENLTIMLPEDIVKTDDEGSLSLSLSLQAATQG